MTSARDAGAVILPSELWSHSVESCSMQLVGLMCSHERNEWMKEIVCEVWLWRWTKEMILAFGRQYAPEKQIDQLSTDPKYDWTSQDEITPENFSRIYLL